MLLCLSTSCLDKRISRCFSLQSFLSINYVNDEQYITLPPSQYITPFFINRTQASRPQFKVGSHCDFICSLCASIGQHSFPCWWSAPCKAISVRDDVQMQLITATQRRMAKELESSEDRCDVLMSKLVSPSVAAIALERNIVVIQTENV